MFNLLMTVAAILFAEGTGTRPVQAEVGVVSQTEEVA
jgi:hypothetical protein